jgi:hypothetical protein
MTWLLIVAIVAFFGFVAFVYFKGKDALPNFNNYGKGMEPHECARQFFASIMESQCHVSWALFSDASQQKFSEWTLAEIYGRNKESAEAANMGLPEIVLMFEANDSQILKYFWRRFFFSSGAGEIFRFGYFSTYQVMPDKAVVKVALKYPNGQNKEIGLPMVKNRGTWCLAYVEHNLPF